MKHSILTVAVTFSLLLGGQEDTPGLGQSVKAVDSSAQGIWHAFSFVMSSPQNHLVISMVHCNALECTTLWPNLAVSKKKILRQWYQNDDHTCFVSALWSEKRNAIIVGVNTRHWGHISKCVQALKLHDFQGPYWNYWPPGFHIEGHKYVCT